MKNIDSDNLVEKKQVNVRIGKTLISELKLIGLKKDMTFQDVVEDALKYYVQTHPNGKGINVHEII